MLVGEWLVINPHVSGGREERERSIRGCPLDQADRDAGGAIGERQIEQDQTELTDRQNTPGGRGGPLMPEPEASASDFIEQSL